MATAAVASDSNSDWGQPESTQAVHKSGPGPKSKAAVRDDWEDEEEEELPSDEGNKRMWEEANSKATTPMPEVSTSSSRSITSPPPPGAFQPALKILKRPTNSTSMGQPRTPSPASSESLKEREIRYQEARNRIFGDAGSGSELKLSPPSTTIARNPYGPSQGTTAEGFNKRLAPAPPTAGGFSK
ncbi:hypothetical protein L218DRAFT_962328 [Marasmius fiardii PR-910]|nr:hypothetical protein L218DRAFT_962328 [Marasmius fiardii PR-910]